MSADRLPSVLGELTFAVYGVVLGADSGLTALLGRGEFGRFTFPSSPWLMWCFFVLFVLKYTFLKYVIKI